MPDSTNIIAYQTADLAAGTISPEQITCTQYDRQAKLIAVRLKENGKDWTIPTGYRANVRMRKADGLYVYNTCTTEGNIAYITLTEQMCGVVGEQIYVLEVINGDHAVQSVTGRLKVIQNPIDDEEADFTSTPEYTTIQTAVADAQQAAQDAADAAQEVVDENLADYLKKTGGTMQGDLSMGNYNIGHIARLFGSSSATNYIQFFVQGCGGTVTKIYGTNYSGESQSVEVGNGGVTLNSTGPVNLNSGAGTINANNKRIQNVASPTASGDAATMGYVADEISRLKKSCAAAYVPISAAIRPTVSGNPILVQDSVAWPLQSLVLHGKTTQDGTPSPDNPVPLVSAGDEGQIDVTVCGENMVDAENYGGNLTGITITLGDNGGLIANGTPGINNCDIYLIGTYSSKVVVYPSGSKTLSAEGLSADEILFLLEGQSSSSALGDSKITRSSELTCAMIRLKKGKVYNNLAFYPMLNVGSTALPWRPYTGKTVTISTPNGLPGIPVDSGGNYTDSTGQQWICDEIDIKSGKHFKKVKKMVFNGNEPWVQESNEIGNRYKYYFGEKVKSSDKTIGATSMNSNFPLGVSKATWNTKNVYTIGNNEASTTLYVSLNGTETLEEFKSYLSNNNMTVLYIPAEIQEEENSYEELSSQNGATTAYTTADTDLTMQYVADAQKYIDNKIGAISAAMLKE